MNFENLTDLIKRNKHLFLLLLLILFSAFFQLYQINRDFNGLYEYDAAQYQLYSMNLLKYGLSAMLGPVCNVNPLNGNFSYYLYHPYLSIYIFALFFKLFGSTILIGRLIAMFFFALSAICLYFFASKLWTKSLAIWSCFFYLFFPISHYFGKFVAPTFILQAFIFVFLLFYWLWLRHEKSAYFYLMAAFYALGCATDWEAYFLAPLAVIHYRYVLKNKKTQIFTLLFIGALFVAAYLINNYFLTGSFSALQSQWPASLPDVKAMAGENLGFISHMMGRMDFTLLMQGSYYFTILNHLLSSFTLPVLLLVLYFLFNYRTFKYFSEPTIYALFFAALYLLYGLIHPETLSEHITLTTYLSAGFAIICALVISRVSRLLQVLFVALFLVFSFFGVQRLYAVNNTWQHHIRMGKVISTVSKLNDGIAITEPFFSPYIEYRGQRKILYDTYSWERMHYAVNSGKIKYFITGNKDFQGYLINKFPAVFIPDEGSYFDCYEVLFDVQAKSIIQPRRRYNIAFANNIKLIDFSYKRLPYGYFLLEYGWEKSGPVSDQFKVFVHFEDGNGNILFGQDHYLNNGFIDPTRSGYGSIDERYIIKMPDSAKGKKLSVYIGLYNPITGQRVQVMDRNTRDNRVLLPHISIPRDL